MEQAPGGWIKAPWELVCTNSLETMSSGSSGVVLFCFFRLCSSPFPLYHKEGVHRLVWYGVDLSGFSQDVASRYRQYNTLGQTDFTWVPWVSFCPTFLLSSQSSCFRLAWPDSSYSKKNWLNWPNLFKLDCCWLTLTKTKSTPTKYAHRERKIDNNWRHCTESGANSHPMFPT